MDILERLIFPMNPAEFKNDFLFQQPFAQPAAGSQYRGILSWELLYGILESHNDCWLPRQGRLPHEMGTRTGKLVFKDAIKAYKEGRTILVRHSERACSQLQNIADEFTKVFRSYPVDIQLYFTPEGEQGFDWHYDLEDVFIVQSIGSKEFRLKCNTMSKFPFDVSFMKSDFLQEPSGPELCCLLEAGDVLYIPAGWWHKAQALSDSAHLSVGVLRSEAHNALTHNFAHNAF